jgi:hypothetical protein
MGIHELAMTNIESKSKWVRDDAEGIARYVRMLDSLPAFETRAEDEIAKAEAALIESLAIVQRARLALEKKRPLQAAE